MLINFILNYPSVKIVFFSFFPRGKFFLIFRIIYLAFSSKIFFESKSISSSLVQNTVKNDSRDRHGFIKNFFIPIPYETF